MIELLKEDNYKSKIIYKINDSIVGFIDIQDTIDIIDILDVFVESDYRRQGIASKLFLFLLDLYKNRNVKYMLEVRDDNSAAIKLYRKLGFVDISVRKKYYKDADAIIMELKKKDDFMKDVYILAIESSCDETSVSIVKNGNFDVATVVNSQIDIHKLYGGVVPEVASRLHLENITLVLDEALRLANMSVNDMDAIAVTYCPGLLGSLLVGLEAAKTLSLVYNKPFIKVNHMMGHISANNIGQELKYPLISLIISGGHTDLIYMESEEDFQYIGRTLDDAVGECFDKVARILGMPYPGGPNVEKCALDGEDTYQMPRILNDDSFNFSFSGIKSHVNNLVHNANQRGESVNKANVACSFQKAVTEALVSKTRNALRKYGVKNLCVSGGVAASNYIREAITNMCEEEGVKFFIPEKKYCTDNATMIGAAAYTLYKKGEFSDYSVNANSRGDV